MTPLLPAANSGKDRVAAGSVALRLVDLASVSGPEWTDRYLPLLDSSEKERYHRLHFARHAHEYLVTRALVRTELSRNFPVPPQAWRFKANAHGRPEVEAPAGVEGLRFNLSHTSGLVVCALARGCEVGVDVEDVSARDDLREVADRFFSPAEVRELRSLPTERQQDRIFDYWTLKEAYIKARGLGLSVPLDQFSFRLDLPGPIRVELQPALEDDASSWQFLLWSPTPRHRLALAVRGGADLSLSVQSEWVKPGA